MAARLHVCGLCCSISHQNTQEEEKQLIQACKVGDLETVKRLSNRVTLHDWLVCSLLHHAAG